VKIDLMKAFDSVRNFFGVMGFLEKFINRFKTCVTTASFSVSMNGDLVGYFQAKRGLRQGDPLSPYLFVIAMEVFSCMLNEDTDLYPITFHSKCKQIHLPHLCFPDDQLIFVIGDLAAKQVVASLLNQFYITSGMKLNPTKRELYCSGVSSTLIQNLQLSTGFKFG